jgi:hypothetical protein
MRWFHSSGPVHTMTAVLVLAGMTVAFSGCDSWYYRTMKKFGVEKRDILVKRVKGARKSQEEAKEEFKTSLERFKSVINVEGGPLEDKYEKLNRQLERSEQRARDVRDRIDSVRDVSEDLFNEWENELKQYKDRALRRESERELAETRQRCAGLLRAMEKAQRKIEPVLSPLRDRVLFLKHNHNAQAIGAIDAELVNVQINVDSLVADLDQSIIEAEQFIKAMDAAN